MTNPPAAWLCNHQALLPRHGQALDIAAGHGRHALWLAALGLSVTAVDRDADALSALHANAETAGLHVRTAVMDLEGPEVHLGAGRFDVIVVVHYLHRALFPALVGALSAGGLLVYETFTRAQAALGKPSNPRFLLEPGELVELVAPLEVLSAREGFHDGRHIASVVARKSES